MSEHTVDTGSNYLETSGDERVGCIGIETWRERERERESKTKGKNKGLTSVLIARNLLRASLNAMISVGQTKVLQVVLDMTSVMSNHKNKWGS